MRTLLFRMCECGRIRIMNHHIRPNEVAGDRRPSEETPTAADAGPPDLREILGEWVGETVTIHRDDSRPVSGLLVEASPEHLVIQEYLRNKFSPMEMQILKAKGADRGLVSFDLENVLRVTPGDIYARL